MWNFECRILVDSNDDIVDCSCCCADDIISVLSQNMMTLRHRLTFRSRLSSGREASWEGEIIFSEQCKLKFKTDYTFISLHPHIETAPARKNKQIASQFQTFARNFRMQSRTYSLIYSRIYDGIYSSMYSHIYISRWEKDILGSRPKYSGTADVTDLVEVSLNT